MSTVINPANHAPLRTFILSLPPSPEKLKMKKRTWELGEWVSWRTYHQWDHPYPRQTSIPPPPWKTLSANCTWNHFSHAFFSALFAGIYEECCRKDKEGSVMYRWCRMRTRWRQSLARTVALYPRFGMVLPGLC